MVSPAETLRDTLVDPVASGYVEAQSGTPGVFEGPFTASQYGDYAALTDPSVRQGVIDALQRNGFVAGYAREWNLRNTQDYLAEIVLHFKTIAGANAAATSSQARYTTLNGFRDFVDTKRIAGSFGVRIDGAGGFNWTIVVFAKGHNTYAVAGGSPDDYQTPISLAQAESEYAFAPTENSQPAPANTVQPWRLAMVLFLILALMAATVVALVVFWPRQRPA